MELQKIEELIEKYLEGSTSLEEEKVLKDFLMEDNVPVHLTKYQALFGYYKVAKQETANELTLPKKESKSVKWIGFAASLILVSLIAFMYSQNKIAKQENLDTFKSPEEAFVETHKALQMVAQNINSGMENASYLEEYEKTKHKIFK